MVNIYHVQPRRNSVGVASAVVLESCHWCNARQRFLCLCYTLLCPFCSCRLVFRFLLQALDHVARVLHELRLHRLIEFLPCAWHYRGVYLAYAYHSVSSFSIIIRAKFSGHSSSISLCMLSGVSLPRMNDIVILTCERPGEKKTEPFMLLCAISLMVRWSLVWRAVPLARCGLMRRYPSPSVTEQW